MSERTDKIQHEISEILDRTYKNFPQLEAALSEVMRRFGGEALPAEEKRAVGFVWSTIVDGREIVANPLVRREFCTEEVQTTGFLFEVATRLNGLNDREQI